MGGGTRVGCLQSIVLRVRGNAEVSGMADLKSLKGVAEKDKRLIADAEALVGPEPETMGFVKNLFWGNIREKLLFPYPRPSDDENAKCEKILAALDAYLTNEHPSVQIDQEQEI